MLALVRKQAQVTAVTCASNQKTRRPNARNLTSRDLNGKTKLPSQRNRCLPLANSRRLVGHWLPIACPGPRIVAMALPRSGTLLRSLRVPTDLGGAPTRFAGRETGYGVDTTPHGANCPP